MKLRDALRHFAAALIIVSIVVTAATSPHQARADTNDTTILPPTTPLALQATAATEGVKLNWQASQNGSFAVAGYIVARSDDNDHFNDLTTLAGDQTNFTDSDGHAGQWYRVRAIDDQDPSNQSPNSEASKVAEPSPAATSPGTSPGASPETSPGTSGQPQDQPATIAPTQPDTTMSDQLPAEQKLSEPSAPSDYQITRDIANFDDVIKDQTASSQSDSLQTASESHAHQIEASVLQGNVDTAQTLISRLDYENQVILSLLPQLDDTHHLDAARTCQKKEDSLETAFLTFPDQLQQSALRALATCQLIRWH